MIEKQSDSLGNGSFQSSKQKDDLEVRQINDHLPPELGEVSVLIPYYLQLLYTGQFKLL